MKKTHQQQTKPRTCLKSKEHTQLASVLHSRKKEKRKQTKTKHLQPTPNPNVGHIGTLKEIVSIKVAYT